MTTVIQGMAIPIARENVRQPFRPATRAMSWRCFAPVEEGPVWSAAAASTRMASLWLARVSPVLEGGLRAIRRRVHTIYAVGKELPMEQLC